MFNLSGVLDMSKLSISEFITRASKGISKLTLSRRAVLIKYKAAFSVGYDPRAVLRSNASGITDFSPGVGELSLRAPIIVVIDRLSLDGFRHV